MNSEFSCRFNILFRIIKIENFISIRTESVKNFCIKITLWFLQSNFTRAKNRIKVFSKSHFIFEKLKTVFFLIGCNMTLYSGFSKFLNFFYEFSINMILIMKPLFQIFFDRSCPVPSSQKWAYNIFEIHFPEYTISENITEKGLHDIR